MGRRHRVPRKGYAYRDTMTRYSKYRSYSNKYNTARWLRLRQQRLMKSPLCVYCLEVGKREPATIVDHIVRHEGDNELFYSLDNTQSLCKCCHDTIKIREERSGFDRAGFGADGLPLSTSHHWNAE